MSRMISLMKARVGDWRSRLLPLINNKALDIGLLPGHRGYVKFLILGRSRSGSNFLRGLLNSHHQVTVFGEIFQNKNSIGWALPGFGQNGNLLTVFHNEPVRFISEKIYKKFPLDTQAVGFKIFYYHARDEAWLPVWDYLAGQDDIRVIHIKRRNILRTHLSRKLAVITDEWVNTTGKSNTAKSVQLDFNECLQDFEKTRRSEEEHDQLFMAHPKIEVIYEELAQDTDRVMQTVQQFLGVECIALKPDTHKQTQQPLAQAITNYGELKELFAGTPWISFFEE